MSEGRTAPGAVARVGSSAGRVIRAWRTMPHEQRLAAYAAVGLFVSMFLPWYQRQFFIIVGKNVQPASDSQTAWGAFSFVEAAVLLVAAGVLTLLFQRAEGKAFHLPGGDGTVITLAGLWTCALVIWRIFDKQGGQSSHLNVTSYGIEWGIFVTLAIAASLAYAGSRIRAAHQPEPPLPGEDDPRPTTQQPPARSRGQAPPPDPHGPQPSEPRRSSRERRVGWLTARPDERGDEQPPADPPPANWDAPEWPPRSETRRGPSGRVADRHDDPRPPGRRDDASGPHGRGDDPGAHSRDGDGEDGVRSETGEFRRASGRHPQAREPRPPSPVPAEDPPTIRARRQAPPLPPSTPAAQRNQQADEQLTIPLEHDD